MAFDPNNTKVKEALKAQPQNNSKESTEDSVSIPVFVDSVERTKNYTFTLQPSIRQKLDLLAKEHNYNSSSKFLNELIKNMK